MEREEIIKRLSRIKLVASDCDGVLTDGGLYYTEDGYEIKRFHVYDGMGFIMLQEHGIRTAIITGENNPLVKKRAERLNVDYYIPGTKDKIGALTSICNELGISLSESVYLGDDTFDIPAIEGCGFGVAPAEALDYVKEKADYVTQKSGGRGCFREVADMILEIQNGEK